MAINNKRELRLTGISIALTLALFAGLFVELGQHAYGAARQHQWELLSEAIVFAVAMIFVVYGNLVYQLGLMGYYKRKLRHVPVSPEKLAGIYDRTAPSLSILVPSYKEERSVVWQTLMSAALSEYPHKNIVLLIDDPQKPMRLEDQQMLETNRNIPVELQALFDLPAQKALNDQAAFHARFASGDYSHEAELSQLAKHYEEAAVWLEARALEQMAGKAIEALSHADKFFVESILHTPAQKHREFAAELRSRIAKGEIPGQDFLERQYKRLIGLFSVSFSSFERKKYSNLSHEANKAMNLNSYMGLVGKSWREVQAEDGLHLSECTKEVADFTIPDADYINTIDADSLMLGDSVIRLIDVLEQPKNRRLAVAQSSCSSFPGCPKGLERIAGACIDVQFRTHQGYTHWNATFWVGANAMLRRKALEDIRENRMENGHSVAVYIQDRTVIEDTESSVDLINKGWGLYNYPERMTFSATPPDFGSLLIQRRRWANGGLLFLPKLLRYVANSPKNMMLLKEFFMRFHYVASTTTGCLVALLLFFYPFDEIFSTVWLPLSSLPILLLYSRDLKNAGYGYLDSLRVCALNLMLFPILTGGVLKSLQQIITGKKIPFSRTPKIPGRTSAPALYSLIGLLLPLAFVAVSYRDALHLHWAKAAFALLNGTFLVYALVYFMGVKATCQDVVLGAAIQCKAGFRKVENISTAVLQKISLLAAARRQA